MYAVVSVWTVAESQRDEQDHIINEQLVPLVRSQPGFVSGYWMRDPDTGKDHGLTIFDTHASASRFRELVESQTQQAAQDGVTNDILATVEVVADAHDEGSHR